MAFTPNVRAHRPPSPDLSKLQNSKATVPNANGGSVQRAGSASCSAYSKNLLSNLSLLAVRPGCATAPGTITANHAKYTKSIRVFRVVRGQKNSPPAQRRIFTSNLRTPPNDPSSATRPTRRVD